MSPEEQDLFNEYYKMIEEAGSLIKGKFDSIVILTTKANPPHGTLLFKWIDGNGFANYGAAKEWIKQHEQQDTMTDW